MSALPEVDLAPARKAVEEARARAASAEAKECLARAEQDLAGAEKLASTSGAEERSRAAVLASAAVAGAACVDRLEVQARRLAVPSAAAATGGSGEPEKLRARLRKAAEDQRTLEETLAVLQQDLETTENELIRTKAKLKGIETKAEASSAIAEAQTLILRSGDEKVRPTNVARAREKLGIAETQLRGGNYGAAVFFALQAQDLLEKPGRARATSPESPPAGAVVVTASSAKVRSEPRRNAPVIARLPRGTSVVPLAEEGEWTRVEVKGRTGWIAKSLIR